MSFLVPHQRMKSSTTTTMPKCSYPRLVLTWELGWPTVHDSELQEKRRQLTLPHPIIPWVFSGTHFLITCLLPPKTPPQLAICLPPKENCYKSHLKCLTGYYPIQTPHSEDLDRTNWVGLAPWSRFGHRLATDSQWPLSTTPVFHPQKVFHGFWCILHDITYLLWC